MFGTVCWESYNINPIRIRFWKNRQGRTGSQTFPRSVTKRSHAKNAIHKSPERTMKDIIRAESQAYKTSASWRAVTKRKEPPSSKKTPKKSTLSRDFLEKSCFILGVWYEGRPWFGKFIGMAIRMPASTSAPAGMLGAMVSVQIWKTSYIPGLLTYFSRKTHRQSPELLIRPPNTGPSNGAIAKDRDAIAV